MFGSMKLTKDQKIYRISGKSMEYDSMYQGDYLVVDMKKIIKNQDIVVFEMPDKSILVKHYYKKGKHQYFYPFNIKDPLPETGRLMDDAYILGKVVAIICEHKRKHKKI